MSDWLMQSFPAVASALEYRVRGDRCARAKCPNSEKHRRGDSSPSLLLKLADNGGLIFHCRTGCHKSDILASIGMKWRDVCHDRPFKPGPPMQLVKAYQYCDPDGNDVCQVVRYHPKTFRPRRRVAGLDGWVYEINGAPVKRVNDHHEEIGFKWVAADGKKRGDAPSQGEQAVPPLEMWPYNASYLQATADTGKIVLYCEGEKDCDNLMKLGFLATTAQGGASQRFFDRRWAKLFRGRHLVVVPDHDEAGRLFARHYAGCFLDAAAASVTMLHLPGQPEKADVSDWIHRNQKGASDTGPNSQVTKALKALIAKQTGYGRLDIKSIFAKE